MSRPLPALAVRVHCAAVLLAERHVAFVEVRLKRGTVALPSRSGGRAVGAGAATGGTHGRLRCRAGLVACTAALCIIGIEREIRLALA